MLITVWVSSSVGWVSQFYDTCRVRFSQSNLQKGLVLPKLFLKKKFMLDKGINILKIN